LLVDVQPLTGKALDAVRLPPAWVFAFDGAVRSGKTFTSLLEWLKFIRTGPPGLLLMTGRTERTIINNLLMPLQGWLGPARVQLNRGNGTVEILGRQVLLIGADNEAAATKIQGLTLAGAFVDEAAALPESYFNMLGTRLSVPGARMWLSTNPEGPGHWLKKKWLDRARLWLDADGITHVDPDGIDLHRVSFRLDDNPNLGAEYIARVKASYSGLWYKRYIGGQWCLAEGAIFSMWDPSRHVVAWDDLPLMTRVLSVGLDYGTTNPTAAIMLGLGVDRRLYLVDEWRHDPAVSGQRWTDAQLAAGFMGWLNERHLPQATGVRLERVCIDPAAASLKVQLYADGFSGLEDADNAVGYGIAMMASLLHSGQLLVSDRCQGFISEVPGYSWDDKAVARGVDAPIKVADHSIDASRYALASTETAWRTEFIDPVTLLGLGPERVVERPFTAADVI
jgi:PBSX family phage terminase large subunit